MIKVSNLSKVFGPFVAVDKINFHIKKGEIVGLLGPNGAGKTTTMRMLTGFYNPSEGSVKIGGKPLAESLEEAKKSIGYLPESAAIYQDMLTSDYMQFIANSYGLSDEEKARGIDYAVTSTGLQPYYYRPISQLSKGYKQRVGLAAALVHNPSILILDEPTSGLDPNQIVEIQKLIQKLASDKTIILSTHILSEIENTCRRAIIINEGRILQDKPLSELQTDAKGITTVFVKIKGKVTEAAKILNTIYKEKNEEVELISSNKEGTTIIVHTADANGERIFDAAVKNKWKLQELRTEKESLTNVFQNITRKKS